MAEAGAITAAGKWQGGLSLWDLFCLVPLDTLAALLSRTALLFHAQAHLRHSTATSRQWALT